MHSASDGDIFALIDAAIAADSEMPKVEFKDGRGGIGSGVHKDISAFSNSAGGGLIVFGISENRTKRPKLQVHGVSKNIHELQEKLYQFIKDKMDSPGEYSIKPMTYRGTDMVVLAISELPLETKPCFYTDLGINRGSFIRVGNVSRQATTPEVRSFLMYSPEYKYDQQALQSVGTDVLDEAKVVGFLNESAARTKRTIDGTESLEQNMLNMKLITVANGVKYPTYAGALLFAKNVPQKIGELNRYTIRCVRYSDKTVASDILDTADITGTLDVQVDQTIAFVLRNIARSAQLVNSKRVERYEYPEEAIREAVVNAIIHRDYSINQTYVQLAIFSDRIELQNPGTLPPGVTVENLKESQFSRNTTIAAVMHDLKYMEEFGRGIDLIYSRLRDWGLPQPLFKNKSNMFKAILLGQSFNSLNDRQIAIWNTIQERGSVTARSVVELFSDVSRQSINNDLRKLVDSNLITPVGSGINTHYEPNF